MKHEFEPSEPPGRGAAEASAAGPRPTPLLLNDGPSPYRRLDAGQWWLALGLFWLPFGMAITPGAHPRSTYHWMLGLTLFLPGALALCRQRGELARQWLASPVLRVCLASLLWSGITLAWATGHHVAERLKGPLFAAFYLSAWMAWSSRSRDPRPTMQLLFWSGVGLAGAALAAMIAFPWRDIVWQHRMIGLALLDGPNLSAYAMVCAFLWLAFLPQPDALRRTLAWTAMSVLAVFIGWTGSRGAWAGLVVALLGMAAIHRDRRARWLALAAASLAVLVFVALPVELLQRGLSYRPQIFRQALAFIAAHPWKGLGLGSPYQVIAGNQVLTHSHNLFTNVAIETGLPGLALWLVLWAWMGWQGWHRRSQPLGRVLLAVWLFASVALQADGPSFLQSPRPEWLFTLMPLAQALQLRYWPPDDMTDPPAA